jgi:hypothetical protein
MKKNILYLSLNDPHDTPNFAQLTHVYKSLTVHVATKYIEQSLGEKGRSSQNSGLETRDSPLANGW